MKKNLILIAILFSYKSFVYSQNLPGKGNSSLRHLSNVSLSASGRDAFKNDSAQYKNLITRQKSINSVIRLQLENLKKELKKDAFETSEEFNQRVKINEKAIVESHLTELNEIAASIKKINGNLYRFGAMDSVSILLDSTRYNADTKKWKTTMLINRSFQNVELDLEPIEARNLWTQRRTIEINILKSIANQTPELIEILFGKVKENTILLSQADEKNEEIEAFISNKNDKIFEKVEIDAEFPGGTSGWTRYITREMERYIDDLQDDGRSGVVVIQFIVDKEGAVSEVRALPCSEAGVGNCLPPNSKLAEVAVNAVRKGPKWKPAEQNGRQVKAYRRQPVTFQLAE